MQPLVAHESVLLLNCAQASAARDMIRKLRGLQDALWVVSPLQRTIETFLLACPYFDDMGASCSGSAPSSCRAGGSASKRQSSAWFNASCSPGSSGGRQPTVVLHPCATFLVGVIRVTEAGV